MFNLYASNCDFISLDFGLGKAKVTSLGLSLDWRQIDFYLLVTIVITKTFICCGGVFNCK